MTSTVPTKIPKLRWWIVSLLFFAAVLNYLDRQTLSLLAPTIQADLKLTDADYSHVVNLFLIAYTIGYLICGRIVDRLGVRVSMAFFVTWWSISNMLTALATSVRSLGAVRFSLGLGEAGNWPGSAKAVGEWFSAKERAFAVGFYTLGATIGATVAPVLVVWLAGKGGWQVPFVVIGALGLVWMPIWLWLYRPPENHPRITDQERAMILADRAATPAATVDKGEQPASSWAGDWREALRSRHVWLLMFARFLTDPVWYFYQFWFAKYLFSEHAVNQSQLKVTWVVYLAADVGALLGGVVSGLLIRKGKSPISARLWAMLFCALVMPLSMTVPFCSAVHQVLLVGIVVVLAHLAWLANLTALVIDRCPPKVMATSFGIIAAGSAVGGVMMNKVIVSLVEQGHYSRWFLIAGILHPIAIALLYFVGMNRGSTQASRN